MSAAISSSPAAKPAKPRTRASKKQLDILREAFKRQPDLFVSTELLSALADQTGLPSKWIYDWSFREKRKTGKAKAQKSVGPAGTLGGVKSENQDPCLSNLPPGLEPGMQMKRSPLPVKSSGRPLKPKKARREPEPSLLTVKKEYAENPQQPSSSPLAGPLLQSNATLKPSPRYMHQSTDSHSLPTPTGTGWTAGSEDSEPNMTQWNHGASYWPRWGTNYAHSTTTNFQYPVLYKTPGTLASSYNANSVSYRSRIGPARGAQSNQTDRTSTSDDINHSARANPSGPSTCDQSSWSAPADAHPEATSGISDNNASRSSPASLQYPPNDEDTDSVHSIEDTLDVTKAPLKYLTVIHKILVPNKEATRKPFQLFIDGRATPIGLLVIDRLTDASLVDRDPFQASMGLVFLSRLGLRF